MTDRASDPDSATESLTDALAAVAMTCQGEECRHLKRHEIVEVTSFDVAAAWKCQASAAAPSAPFRADMFTVTKTLALRAVPGLRRHDSALAAVGAIMREAQRVDDGAADDDWLRSFLKDSPIDVRARVAARASGWLTRLLDLLDVSDVAETRRWRVKVPLRWDYPGRGLRLRASLDVVVPHPEQPGQLLPVVVGSSGSAWLHAELAYLHVLWKSSQRPVSIRPEREDGAAPSRRPTTRAAVQLDEVLVVDFQESTATRRTVSNQWEQGLAAARNAAEAVTERENILASVNELEPDPNLWPSSVLGSWFPSQLDQHPHRWRCRQCVWLPACPSPSVSSDAVVLGDVGPTPDQPTNPFSAGPEPTTNTGTNPGDIGPPSETETPEPVLVGGVRLADHHPR